MKIDGRIFTTPARSPQPDPAPDPWRSLGEVAASIVVGLRFRRAVEALHSKGPRLVAEFLAELGARHNLRAPIEGQLERYLAIDEQALVITGGDQFPSAPIHEVSRERG